MNHIELYEKTINDLSIDFDLRHYMKQFYAMDVLKASDIVGKILRLLTLKQIDLDTLKRSETFDMRHN